MLYLYDVIEKLDHRINVLIIKRHYDESGNLIRYNTIVNERSYDLYNSNNPILNRKVTYINLQSNGKDLIMMVGGDDDE